MTTTENQTEPELIEHVEKLIDALRGSKIAEVWFQFKNGQPPMSDEAHLNQMDSAGNQGVMPP